MAYFKYTKSAFLDSMLNKGTLKIGNLYEYRECEEKEIGDENEGKATGRTFVRNETYKSQDELPGLFKDVFKIFGNSEVTFTDITVERQGEVKNQYIYCLTKNPSRIIMEHFNCDVCVEILDIQKFVGEMAIQLYNDKIIKSKVAIVHDCFYEKREVRIQNDRDAFKVYWLKDPGFIHQAEYRIVMEANEPVKEGLVHDFPKIRECLRVVTL